MQYLEQLRKQSVAIHRELGKYEQRERLRKLFSEILASGYSDLFLLVTKLHSSGYKLPIVDIWHFGWEIVAHDVIEPYSRLTINHSDEEYTVWVYKTMVDVYETWESIQLEASFPTLEEAFKYALQYLVK